MYHRKGILLLTHAQDLPGCRTLLPIEIQCDFSLNICKKKCDYKKKFIFYR